MNTHFWWLANNIGFLYEPGEVLLLLNWFGWTTALGRNLEELSWENGRCAATDSAIIKKLLLVHLHLHAHLQSVWHYWYILVWIDFLTCWNWCRNLDREESAERREYVSVDVLWLLVFLKTRIWSKSGASWTWVVELLQHSRLWSNMWRSLWHSS